MAPPFRFSSNTDSLVRNYLCIILYYHYYFSLSMNFLCKLEFLPLINKYSVKIQFTINYSKISILVEIQNKSNFVRMYESFVYDI